MPDIFLSYNREDQARAQCFAEAFKAEDFSVWWDVTLRSGEAYDQVTEEALRTAKAVVVLWSKKSVVSRWVRAEATIALRNNTLLPAMIEPCDRPVMFELTQTADLSHWDGKTDDKAWLAFLDDARRMAGRTDNLSEAAPSTPSAAPAGGMPVVAVLPITQRGGDAMEWLAEELTEDITGAMSQSHYCKLIAATTMAGWRGKPVNHKLLASELGAAYLVEGKLRAAGETLWLTMQIIETESDSMLSSSRFSARADEIEAAPEQLTLPVAAAMNQAIAQSEMNRALAKQGRCSPWEHVLRSWALVGRLGSGSRRAMEEAQQAVKAAPDYGMAHAVLANALSGRVQVERLTLSADDRESMITEALQAIRRAIELDGQSPFVLTRLANAYSSLGDAEAALNLAQRAAKLAPHSAEVRTQVGTCYFMLGRTTEAIEAFHAQDRIAYADPDQVGVQALLGICLFIEGLSDEAETAIDKSLASQPNFYLALRWKAIIAADLGKEQSAKAAIKMLRKTEPGKSVDDYLDSPKHLPVEHPRKYEAIAILRRLLEETETDA